MRGAGGRKTFSKNIKKKTSHLAAGAREVQRASSGFPASRQPAPPPAAARVSPQPQLGRSLLGRVRRSVRFPSPHPPILRRRAGPAAPRVAGVCQGARSPR